MAQKEIKIATNEQADTIINSMRNIEEKIGNNSELDEIFISKMELIETKLQNITQTIETNNSNFNTWKNKIESKLEMGISELDLKYIKSGKATVSPQYRLDIVDIINNKGFMYLYLPNENISFYEMTIDGVDMNSIKQFSVSMSDAIVYKIPFVNSIKIIVNTYTSGALTVHYSVRATNPLKSSSYSYTISSE